MRTGNATSVARLTVVAVTTTGAGHRVPARTNVHQGTPNSSARIAVIVAPNRNTRNPRSARNGRLAGAACTAWPADTATLLDRRPCSMTRRLRDRPLWVRLGDRHSLRAARSLRVALP